MNKKVLKKTKGFTITEILVALAIVAIMSTVIAINFLGKTEEAKFTRVKGDLTNLQSALMSYYNDNGFFPTTDQGLDALVRRPTQDPIPNNYQKGGYISGGGVVNDPWGKPYQYISPGVQNDYDLFSMGKDGRPGGQGQFQDISVWNMNAINLNAENQQ